MKQSKTSKLAYFAGILDGEGTIGIYKKNDSNSEYNSRGRGLSLYKLSISIGQKRGPIIDWLAGNFGGRIFTKQQVTTVPGSKKFYDHEMYEWRLDNIEELIYLLKRIIPFLTEKKDQAELALQFAQRHQHVKNTGTQCGFVTKIPDDVLEEWKKFAEEKSKQLKKLKRKHVPSAAVETKFSKPSNDGKL